MEVREMRKACRRISARWKKGLKEWLCSTTMIKDGMFVQGKGIQKWLKFLKHEEKQEIKQESGAVTSGSVTEADQS